ncbi:rod shape-determining protein MreC [Elusimicrobiota bacterium]
MHRDKRVANYLLLIFSFVSIVLLALPLTGKVRALRACVSYLLNPIPYYGSGAVERLAHLPGSAARLISGDVQLVEARRQLREAELHKAEVEALRRENARLRSVVGMEPPSGRMIRWARVMERDPLNWHRSVMVGAGSEDGVKVNSPVLGLYEGRLGVAGRVTEVGLRTAKVLLLTDELSAVAGWLPGQGWEGLIQGQGSFKLRMNYLPVEAKFSAGDAVFTSPTSATFPAGLPVGSISMVFERDPFLAFQSVEISPAVQAAALKEVMILEPEVVPVVVKTGTPEAAP